MSISTLIITRGNAPHLRSVLGSIRSQQLLPEQVVIVAESNIDEIKNLLFRVLDDYVPRLEVVKGADQGAASAWNLGIEYCDCEFIAIIDDDDLWLPSHLSVCEAATRYVGADLVLTGFYKLSDTEFKEDMLPPSILETKDFMMFNPGMRGSNIFVRKSCIQECEGFDESLATSSDRGLGIRLSQIKGIQYAPLLKRTVVYRSHSGSRMVDPSPERLESFNRLLNRYSDELNGEQRAYTMGRINEFWGYPLDSLMSEKYDKDLMNDWRDFLLGESNPEDYPEGFNQVLKKQPKKMMGFLENEYHRRMRNYDVNYPNSITHPSPPEFRKLIAQTLEDAAHPVCRNWVRKIKQGHVVDYGCGNGQVLIPLLSQGYKIALFDPDQKHQRNHAHMLEDVNHDLLENGLINIEHDESVFEFVKASKIVVTGVVCSMVLCQVQNEIDLKRLLDELYSILPVGRKALISWCSPTLLDVDKTHVHEIQMRDNNQRYYEKICSQSGQHRPEYVWDIEQIDLLSPDGFEVSDEWFVWGWDTENDCAVPWIQFCEMRRDR